MTTTARLRLLTIPAAAAGTLAYGLVAAVADEIEFDVADVYAELNDTDGDLGFHALIDGEAWRRLEIEAPNGRELLELHLKSRLRQQGLTELFFESAEPSFDELAPRAFFRRFPEGDYEIEGLTLEGEELESTDTFSHLIPAPVGGIMVNDSEPAETCDDPLPVVSPPVTISWNEVTMSHPAIGRTDEPIDIVRYEFVVEFEFVVLDDSGEEVERVLVFSVDLLPPAPEDDDADVLSFEVPQDFTAVGDEFKFEILAIAADGNRTAVESCFEVEEEDEEEED